MKLEPKYITPYLPYSIRFSCNYSGKTYLSIATGIIGDNIYDEFSDKYWSYNIQFDDVKLILRNLSDLTKEIEHNGERFVPKDELLDDDDATWEDDGAMWSRDLFNKNTIPDTDFVPYGLMQKLLSWHFDIYGLIEAGLAIDINTLNK